MILKKVVDSQHEQCVKARVQINGRCASFKLLVRSVQETEVCLRNQLVNRILHPIRQTDGNGKISVRTKGGVRGITIEIRSVAGCRIRFR